MCTDRGELTFTSITALDRATRQLLLAERHQLVHRGEEHVVDYKFVMRCWESGEPDALFARHGFGNVSYFGAYDSAVEAGATGTDTAVLKAIEIVQSGNAPRI